MLAQASFYPAFFQDPILINGRVFAAAQPATVAATLERAGHNPNPGNLLDVDGRVLRPGEGTASQIRLNGRPVDGLTAVDRDDSIEFIPGSDRVEPTKTATEAVVLAARVSGAGEYAVLQSKGKPGQKLVTRGSVSGKIVSARTLTAAKPMVVTRTNVRPEKVVALTFDDGPNPPFTGQIIKILKDAQATATFFMLGRQVALYPKPVKKIQRAGFQVANHSFSHGRLDRMLEPDVIREIDDTRNLLFPLTNVEPTWLRPPYGAGGPVLEAVAQSKGYRVVRWNIDTRDWEAANSDAIANQVISGVFPGAIILMHDGGGNRTNTVMALPKIIQVLREAGYTFVTLDQMVK